MGSNRGRWGWFRGFGDSHRGFEGEGAPAVRHVFAFGFPCPFSRALNPTTALIGECGGGGLLLVGECEREAGFMEEEEHTVKGTALCGNVENFRAISATPCITARSSRSVYLLTLWKTRQLSFFGRPTSTPQTTPQTTPHPPPRRFRTARRPGFHFCCFEGVNGAPLRSCE